MAIFYYVINSDAFKDLSGNGSKLFILMLAKVKSPLNGDKRYFFEISLSYSEIIKWGMVRGTAYKAINELIEKGFIDLKVRGGLKGCNGVSSKYNLSMRYKNYIHMAKHLDNSPENRLVKKAKKASTGPIIGLVSREMAGLPV